MSQATSGETGPRRQPVVASAVSAPPWVASVEVIEEVASTNTELIGRGDSAPTGSVLVAEFQSAGRGRLERTWVSPPRAGLTASVLVRPTPPTTTWGWLPLLVGVALCDALSDADVALADAVGLKWPNDVLLGERKAAGILVQRSGPAVVAGFGVNLSTTAPELPADTATSVWLTTGVELDRTALLGAVLRTLGTRLRAWEAAGGSADEAGLAAAYRRRCRTLGRTVTVQVGAESISGRAEDVDAAGRLVVSTAAGRRSFSAGDVTHVRPPAL